MAALSARPSPSLDVEEELFRSGYGRLAALDEVGRGALAGPVSVGAVVIDVSVGVPPTGLRDSKLLSPAQRAALMAPVADWVLCWSIGHASPAEIDRVGMSAALGMAARRALRGLSVPVDAILLDGTFDYVSAPCEPDLFAAASAAGENDVILHPRPVTTRAKADRDCASVAAASVLAKVTRDALMIEMDGAHPHYGWAQNKGYGTGAHVDALVRYGPCDAHRRSWRLPTALSAGASQNATAS